MGGKEHELITRELVEAGDKVMVSFQKWKANPTPENQSALLAARIEYLESEATLEVYLREHLQARVKVLEERLDAQVTSISALERKGPFPKGRAKKNLGKRKGR